MRPCDLWQFFIIITSIQDTIMLISILIKQAKISTIPTLLFSKGIIIIHFFTSLLLW